MIKIIILGDERFSKCFSDVVVLEKNNELPTPVCSHPDMNILKIDNTIFLPKNHYLAPFIKQKGYDVKFISETLSNLYPFDVKLNAKQVGNLVLMNTKTISKDVLEFCEKTNKTIIDVPQGYAACSCLCINENAFITADKGIYNALKNADISPLLIKEGYIEIDTYDYGFIGGASGFVDGVLYFFGDITAHPDFIKIDKYLKNYNVCYKWFDSPLYDIGGVLEI